jgi:integrase
MKNYVGNLRPFRQWWAEWGPANDFKLSPTAFKEFDLWYEQDFRTNMQGHPITNHAMHKTGLLLQSFCEWLYAEGCTPINISKWVVDRPLVRVPQYFPEIHEVETVFNYADRHEDRMKYVPALAFMFDTGCRRMEVAYARIENLSFKTPITNLRVGADHRGQVWLTQTKGNKARFVAFGNKTGLLLKCWLRSYGRSSGPIFGLQKAGLAMVIKRASIRCKLPELSCHCARRLFCDYWMDKHERDPFALTILKLQVGHALHDADDVTSTRYINLHNERKLLERLHKFHVSIIDELEFDWADWPVDLSPDKPETPILQLGRVGRTQDAA